MITRITDIQQEAVERDLFLALGRGLQQIDRRYFSQGFVGLVAQLNCQITLEVLKDKFLLDFVWPLAKINFLDDEITVDYFKFIRIIYIRDIYNYCDLYGVSDIVKLLLRIPLKFKVKIKAVLDLLSGIFSIFVTDYSKQRQQYLALNLHRVLSFCNSYHEHEKVQELLNILLQSLLYLDTQSISSLFQDFDTICHLIILFNDTKMFELQIRSLKLINVITKGNHNINIADVVKCLQLGDNVSNQIHILNSLFEWMTDQVISLKSNDSAMFDEDATIKQPAIFGLLVKLLVYGPSSTQQYILQRLYAMTRNNQKNQEFMAKNYDFQVEFIRMLVGLYKNKDSQIEWVFNNGVKLLNLILMYGLNFGSIYLFQHCMNVLMMQDFECSMHMRMQFLREIFARAWQNVVSVKNELLMNPHSCEGEFQRGVSLMLLQLLLVISQEEYQAQEEVWYQTFKSTGPFKIHIINYPQKDVSCDYIFLPKLIKLISIFLYPLIGNASIDEDWEIMLPRVKCITQEQSQQLAKKLFHCIDKTNISIMFIIYQYISLFSQYIVSFIAETKTDDLKQLLRSMCILTIALLIGLQGEQKRIVVSTAFIHLHYSLLEVFQDRLPLAGLSGNDYFDQLSLQRSVEELSELIIQSLQQYLEGLLQTDLWQYASEIVRLNVSEGPITQADFKLFILKDTTYLLSEEARSFYQHAPSTVEVMEQFTMDYEEIQQLIVRQRPQSLQPQEKQRSNNQDDLEKIVERYRQLQRDNWRLWESQKQNHYYENDDS